MNKFILSLFFFICICTFSYAQILDDIQTNHLSDYKLRGKPRTVSQRLYTILNDSLPLSSTNLKERGPLSPLGSDVFDIEFDETGKLKSETIYKTFNDSIVVHEAKQYSYNKNARLVKLVIKYFNDAPFSNDDINFSPPENRTQTQLFYYDNYDNVLASKISKHRVEKKCIISKTYNAKKVLLDSTLWKYHIDQRFHNKNKKNRVNTFRTFFSNNDDYDNSTYKTYSIYDNNNRLTYLEMYPLDMNFEPNYIWSYRYINKESLDISKVIVLDNKTNSFHIKLYEYNSNHDVVSVKKQFLDGTTKVFKKYNYKYDKHNNWIEKIEYTNRFMSRYVFKRTIKYYD